MITNGNSSDFTAALKGQGSVRYSKVNLADGFTVQVNCAGAVRY